MGKDVKWYDYFKDNRRYADIINAVACKAVMGVDFAIIGIENQDEIDYELPVRIMEYDVTRYRQQIAAINKAVRESPKNLSPGEYMYGFKKDSHLYPVTTIVLYAGVEAWNGPESLCEMIDFKDIPDSVRELIQDYKIKVVDIRRLTDTSMFKTDVRKVFDFIRYAERKRRRQKSWSRAGTKEYHYEYAE